MFSISSSTSSSNQNQNKKIRNYRSKDLSVFSLFNLNRNDSIHVLSILDDIDHNYTHQVNIQQFTTKYCPDYIETFMYIFEKFYLLLDNSINQPKLYEIPVNKLVDDDDDDNDDGDVNDDDTNDVNTLSLDDKKKNVNDNSEGHISIDYDRHDIDDDNDDNESKKDDKDKQQQEQNLIDSNKIIIMKVPYNYFLCFLLTLLSIPDAQVILWLHWLSFRIQNTLPSMQALEEMIERLWGKLATSKKYEKNYIYNKTKAQNLTITLDPTELTPSKIRIFDLNTRGIWTTPVLLLRKQIRLKTRGYFFWNRVAPTIFAAISNIDESYDRLKEPYR